MLKLRSDSADEIGVVKMIFKKLVIAVKLLESEFSTRNFESSQVVLTSEKDVLEYKQTRSPTEQCRSSGNIETRFAVDHKEIAFCKQETFSDLTGRK